MAKLPSGSGRGPADKPPNNRRDPVAGQRIESVASTSGTLAGSIGAIFRSARVGQRLSQDQVAALTSGGTLEVSRTTISAIERGSNLPGLEVLVSLSRVLQLDPSEVLELVELQSAQPVDLTGISRAELGRRAEEAFWAGDFRRALSTYDAVLQHLVLDPPANEPERLRLQVRNEVNRAATLRRLCALSASRAAAERAIAQGGRFPELQAEAYEVLATVLIESGKLEFARDAADHAIRLSSKCEPRVRGMAWLNKGQVCFEDGDHEGARVAFLEARKLFAEAFAHTHLIHVEGNIGSCLLEQKKPGLAREHFVSAVDLARRSAAPALEAYWLVEIGRVDYSEGRLDRADSFAEAASQIAKPADQVLTIFRAEWLRHQIATKRDPAAVDRHRLAYLVRLYGRLGEHRGLAVIREFEAAVINPTEQGSGGPHD